MYVCVCVYIYIYAIKHILHFLEFIYTLVIFFIFHSKIYGIYCSKVILA